MSTPQEYRRVADELAQLRTAIETLAAEWERDAEEHLDRFGQHMPAAVSRMAERLREGQLGRTARHRS